MMDTEQKLIDQLDNLFNPASVAVVGVPRGMKVGKLFLLALLEQGFPGPIYPVNPKAQELEGLKAYPSVSAIPHPIDLAIILVPHSQCLSVLRECGDKGVKGAVLFTAGYKETGTEEGQALEKELVRTARESGMRLVGPNGMGFYSPGSGLSFFPQLSRKTGPVGVISHSGSLSNLLGKVAIQKGLGFSKVVSIGNECDLSYTDFMNYLKQDQDTGLIGCYLEGVREGPRFLESLKKTSLEKPVIIWKVGLTPEGTRAAASHTGAIGGSKIIWDSVVKQGGGIPVSGFEAWVDALMGFSMLKTPLGDRIAIISGPGGLAVGASEACGREGLRLAELTDDTKTHLGSFIPPTGTSLKNPIDVGFTAFLEMDIYIRSARAVAADPGVDAVVAVGIGQSQEVNRRYREAITQIKNELGKPFMMINIPGFESELGKDFCDAEIPFFESSERAMHTYALVRRYQQWRMKIQNIGAL